MIFSLNPQNHPLLPLLNLELQAMDETGVLERIRATYTALNAKKVSVASELFTCGEAVRS